MAEEVLLMKGNEAIARAAIRYGVDGYFGYPITPQSEVLVDGRNALEDNRNGGIASRK